MGSLLVIVLSIVKSTRWLVFLPRHLHETTTMQPLEVCGQEYSAVCFGQVGIDQ